MVETIVPHPVEGRQLSLALSTTSRTPSTRRGWTVLGPDVPREVAALKARPGRELLVVGSGRLAYSLFEHELVDEYRLMIHPVVVGSGKRLFAETVTAPPMDLIDARTTTSGLVLLTYRPASVAP